MDFEEGLLEVSSSNGVSKRSNEENVKAMVDFASVTGNGNVSNDYSDIDVPYNLSIGTQFWVCVRYIMTSLFAT